MERPQNLTPDYPAPFKSKRITIAVTLIILFHLVGLIGLSVSYWRPIFLQIVPYHLLLMMLILFFSHKQFDARFIFFILLVFTAGFIAEWIGVHTGWLFGSYTYGKTLGIKIDEIPLMIGVNWFLLIYATGTLMQRSRLKNLISRLLTGAFLLVLLDVLIEPVAIRFNYWHWADHVIPGKNYVCWFLISLALLFVFEKFRFQKQSIVAPILLITQFLFFIALLLMHR